MYLSSLPEWYIKIREHPFKPVKRHWVNVKYIKGKFKQRLTRSFKRYDFNKYWYYIDEISASKSTLQGPVSRRNILALKK